MSDRLEELFVLQAKLQAESFGHDLGALTDEQRMRYIRDNALALTDEVHEALAECGWKPWSTSNHLNTYAYLSELVDAFHFLMNLLLATGFTPEYLADDLHERYLRKHRVNAQRQADGYDGVSTKCPGCGRALDDEGVLCALSINGEAAYCSGSSN